MTLMDQGSVAQSTAPSTVWVENVSWFDRVPRWVAMLAIMVLFIGIWQLTHMTGLVSPILLPSPGDTVGQIFFV